MLPYFNVLPCIYALLRLLFSIAIINLLCIINCVTNIHNIITQLIFFFAKGTMMARINISIPEEIIKKVDTYKVMVKVSRSGFILNALENYFIQVERKLLEDKKKDAYQGILSIREMASPLFKEWDSTSEIRKLRDNRWSGDKK